MHARYGGYEIRFPYILAGHQGTFEPPETGTTKYFCYLTHNSQVIEFRCRLKTQLVAVNVSPCRYRWGTLGLVQLFHIPYYDYYSYT
jgi:hypothetical protein